MPRWSKNGFMFDNEAEIIKVVTQSKNDQSELFDRFEEDYDYAVGEEYVTPAGYESYTSTAPQNFMDKVTDGMNQAEMTLQIKLGDDSNEEEREAASLAELYLFGALNDIDRNLRSRGEKPLRQGLGFFINVRGWYDIKCLVYDRDGQTYFDVQPLDPMHATYEYGSRGLLWHAYTRWASRAAIKSQYNIDVRNEKGAEIIDFWDEDRNCILVDGLFGKTPTAHKLEELPFLHGSVASMPTMQSRDYMPTLKDRGLSVFSAAKKTFEAKNRFISELMDVHKKSIVGSILHTSKTGQKKLKGDPHRSYMEIQLEEGETLKMLELPLVPEVTGALMSILNDEAQQSMLPYPLAYGGAEENFSGRALGILSDATRSVYNPRTSALDEIYVWLSEQLLSQFRLKGAARDFSGYDPAGKYFKVKVKPNDLKEGWFVSASFSPKLPRDLEQDVQTAMLATSTQADGTRLLSMGTALEEIVKIRDPDAERDKKLRERGENLEPIIIQEVAGALVKSGQVDLARQVLNLMPPLPGAPGPGTPGIPTDPNSGVPVTDGGTPGPGPLPEDMVQAIAQIFIQADQQELGAAVLSLLGVPIPGPGQNGAVPAPAPVV